MLLHRDLTEHYETHGRWQGVEEAMAYHADVVTPFVRNLPGKLFDCDVRDAQSTLVPAIQRHVAQRTRHA